MRKHIVAGNWKMNTTVPEGIELAKAVVAGAAQVPADVKLIIATPFTHLYHVAEVVKGTPVALSAENCADKEKGAYTGEVSAAMLASVGCEYTILGHSERRQYYGETDEKLVEKTKLALANGLDVILCVGENLEEREAGKHFDVSLMSRFGQSEQARPPLPLRLRKSTPSSARPSQVCSELRSQRRPPFSMAVPANLQMPRNSLLRRISTVDSSVALPSRLRTSSASHCHSDRFTAVPQPRYVTLEFHDFEGDVFSCLVGSGRVGPDKTLDSYAFTFFGRH